MNKPNHISDTIKEVFESIDKTNSPGVSKKNILASWETVVGEKAAAHSKPIELRGETLLVSVDSAVWIYQLRLKEKELLKKLKTLLGVEGIKKIRLRAGQ